MNTVANVKEWCEDEIEHLRTRQPDFDILFVDALDRESGEIVARLRCQFRPPYHCGFQDGKLLDQDENNKKSTWKYRFTIGENDPARVLYEFLSVRQHMTFNLDLLCSDRHDKFRDNKLRQQAERCADADVEVNEMIEREMARVTQA